MRKPASERFGIWIDCTLSLNRCRDRYPSLSLPVGPMCLVLALDNVLDRQHQQFVGFPALGRRFRTELRGSS